MNLEAELNKRFKKAIDEIIKPPVLVSDRWLKAGAGKGEFQFMGTMKISKATGRKAQRIASQLLRRMDLDDLKLSARISPSGIISITPSKRKGPAKKATKAKAPKPDSQ